MPSAPTTKEVYKEFEKAFDTRYVKQDDMQDMTKTLQEVGQHKADWDARALQKHYVESDDCKCGLCEFTSDIYRKGAIQGAQLAEEHPEVDWGDVE